MAKEISKMGRMDSNFQRDMKEIAKIRLQKGLAKFNQKDMGTAEMTRLLRRTQGFRLSLEELKTKPKRENII